MEDQFYKYPTYLDQYNKHPYNQANYVIFNQVLRTSHRHH